MSDIIVIRHVCSVTPLNECAMFYSLALQKKKINYLANTQFKFFEYVVCSNFDLIEET